MNPTPTERMVTAAAAEFEDGETAFVGVGVPMLACNLAKCTHAPALQLVYESGIWGAPVPRERLPTTVGDPRLVSGAVGLAPMFEGFSTYLQGGHVDAGLLGGAQVDRFGNVNSTVIGDYENPDVRLPGSGGACDIAVNADRTVVITPHERRRFPEQVDFVTSPGYVDGREGRTERGLTGGPSAVVTDKAVMRFDETGQLYVDSLHPGGDRETVRAETGWEIPFADDLGETAEPTDEDLRLLREELDPTGVYV